MPNIVNFPRCFVCGDVDPFWCTICSRFACRDCTIVHETWGVDNTDVDLECEHELPDLVEGSEWDYCGSTMSPEGLSRIR